MRVCEPVVGCSVFCLYQEPEACMMPATCLFPVRSPSDPRHNPTHTLSRTTEARPRPPMLTCQDYMVRKEAPCLDRHLDHIEALVWPRLDLLLKMQADR